MNDMLVDQQHGEIGMVEAMDVIVRSGEVAELVDKVDMVLQMLAVVAEFDA